MDASFEEREERSSGIKPSFVVAGAFLILVAAGGAWFALSPAGQTGTPEASQASGQAVVSVQPTSGGDESVCGMEPGDQAIPTTPLGPTAISVGSGLYVPSVEGAGPGVTEGVSHCFAHSPKGAVVAAANFVRWFSSNQQLPEVTRTLTQAGADQERLVADISSGWEGTTVAPVGIAGYKVTVRSADEVFVELTVTAPGDITQRFDYPLVMVWDQGDWKVQLPSNDEWGIRATTVADTPGWVPWPFA